MPRKEVLRLDESKEIGRPRKYTNVEELEKLINEYFDVCNKEERPYTITGLALYLDLTRETLLRYEDSYTNEFSDAIKKAKQRIQEFVECCLFKPKIATGVIFNLKNNFGWADKTEIDHKGSINVKLEDVL